MNMRQLHLIISIFTIHVILVVANDISDLYQDRVSKGIETVSNIIEEISNRWDIRNYPTFLRSVAMSKTSWEVMKLKYKHKILSALESEKRPRFVISFLGSSVTAGHDTMFNMTFSEVTRDLMKPAFDAMNIDLVVINGAMGNNPCLPYDVCIRAFAGPDADIVHWEQVTDLFYLLQELLLLLLLLLLFLGLLLSSREGGRYFST